MAFEADFLDFFTAVLQWRRGTPDREDWGGQSYDPAPPAAPLSLLARVEDSTVETVSERGAEVRLRTVAYIAGDQGVTTDDWIRLPDGRTPPIAVVETNPDPDGVHHQRVVFG